jgi:endonuclease YncB( thermonuclease family)
VILENKSGSFFFQLVQAMTPPNKTIKTFSNMPLAYLSALFVVFSPSLLLAHSGCLDRSGGHNDHQAGGYHGHVQGGGGGGGGTSFSSGRAKRKPLPVNETQEARVVRVVDGDTIIVLVGNREVVIRLYGIDAPEKKQDYGQACTAAIKKALQGRDVSIVPIEQDKYGRTVAQVYVDGASINKLMVQHGYAQVFTKYCKQDYCREWKKLENEARKQGVGMWANPYIMSPSEWRRLKRDS